MKEKILITDLEFNKAVDIFESCSDFKCISAPTEEKALADMVVHEKAKYVIVGVNKYIKELYEALPSGGVIARFGVGHDGIDKAQAKSKGIYCTNTPGVLDDSVAECAIAMMLTAARNIDKCTADMKNHKWQNRLGFELAGKTLAIVGCGNIGTKVAKIAKFGFGMKISGFDINTPKQLEYYDRFDTCYDAAVNCADFISLHIPNIAATQGFINREKLSFLKSTAWLINTSRGGVLNEDNLFDAVQNKSIGGAVLDVFQNEPYIPRSNKDLRIFDNIIMTPHIGSSTIEACNRMANMALQNITKCLYDDITHMNII